VFINEYQLDTAITYHVSHTVHVLGLCLTLMLETYIDSAVLGGLRGCE
jgi:hypothetical protein